jgi:hypothetical protein
MSNPKPLPPTEIVNPVETEKVGRSCLITDRKTQAVFTSNKETDARTALKRGLQEYLMGLSYIAVGGRKVSFQEVYDVWPDHEDKAVFPSAIVYSIGDGLYDASSFTPTISSRCVTNDGFYLAKYAEYSVDLRVEYWANDPEERVALTIMLEDALNPVDWMNGAKIQLPHYHNQFAIYELKTNNFPDSESDVLSRTRKAYMTLAGQVSAVRCTEVTKLVEVRRTVTVTDGNVDC